MAELGHQAFFLNLENSESLSDDIRGSLVRSIELGKKVILLIDLDMMKSKEFPGKSTAGIDGITQCTMIEIARIIAHHREVILSLVITNFNPTVEKELSSLFLVTLVYKLIKYSLN